VRAKRLVAQLAKLVSMPSSRPSPKHCLKATRCRHPKEINSPSLGPCLRRGPGARGEVRARPVSSEFPTGVPPTLDV
jgi:hypothetical protein